MRLISGSVLHARLITDSDWDLHSEGVIKDFNQRYFHQSGIIFIMYCLEKLKNWIYYCVYGF